MTPRAWSWRVSRCRGTHRKFQTLDSGPMILYHRSRNGTLYLNRKKLDVALGKSPPPFLAVTEKLSADAETFGQFALRNADLAAGLAENAHLAIARLQPGSSRFTEW